MKHRQPLAQYFAPRLSAERAARVWARVARTLPPQRRRWSRPAWRLAIATIAALAVLLTLATAAHDPMDGTVVETGAGQGQLVHLPDGSQLALVAFTRLRLEQVGMHDVRLALEAGALEARVTHVAGRSFVLRAGDVEIRVVGTRFTASRDALGAVEVRVDEGRVTVAEGHGPDRFVEAGQTWQSTLAEAPPVPADET
ncbi:MAG: FecR family protein, partial [Polyangiaceae bacterium]|nr:FecR family protein [Polyangiaceae bacterium]